MVENLGQKAYLSMFLCIKAVTKNFKQGLTTITVLNTISAYFEQSKTYAINGVSGSGKSTLLHILGGLEQPTSGLVTINDKPLATMSDQEYGYFLRNSIGFVFQMPYLLHDLSVIENVMIRGMINGSDTDQCRDKAYELLTLTGLAHKSDSHPAALSGGQQQRIAIVRALYNNPAFLLADEPTSNLDEKTGKDVLDFILDCKKQFNMGVIVSSHDDYVIHAMETVMTLHDGTIIP